MTIRHHVGDDILLAYAAGELSQAWSLLVATHLALCPDCRARLRRAEAVGGALLDELAPAPVEAAALDQVMARLADQRAAEPEEAGRRRLANGAPVLPQPLRRYAGGDLDDLRWRALGRGAYHIPLATGDRTAQARLLRIPAGLPVPDHGHRGRELTLVLAGSFSDGGERFARGDVEEADETVEHQPVAGPERDCICLAVTDAPLRFKSLAARLVQPFLGI